VAGAWRHAVGAGLTPTLGRRTMTNQSDEFLSTPCPCGGTNESCFRCGGWGYIDRISLGRAPLKAGASMSTGLPTPKRKASSRKKNTRPPQAPPTLDQPAPSGPVRLSPEFSACTICGVLVKRMERHMERIHGQPNVLRSVPALNAATELIACAVCGQRMRPSRLELHHFKAHRDVQTNSVFTKVLRELKSSPEASAERAGVSSGDELIGCKTCGKLLPRRRMAEHCWAAHAKRPNPNVKRSPRTPAHPTSDPPPLPTREQGETRRDAT